MNLFNLGEDLCLGSLYQGCLRESCYEFDNSSDVSFTENYVTDKSKTD